MSLSLSLSRRLTTAKTPPNPSIATSPYHDSPIEQLRRAAEDAWQTWTLCTEPVGSPVERRLWAQHQDAEASLQLAINDAQRLLGLAMDSAKCGEARAELLRRIGVVGA